MAFKPEEHLRQLKGQNYLDCVWRVVWVREEHPDAQIETEVVYWDHDKQEIMVRAVVVLPTTGARAVAHCMCSQAEFKFGYSEKAETQAIGRALALLGYGTAFAGADLDEGERVADSPTAARNGSGTGAPAPPLGAQAAAKPAATAARAAASTVTAPVPPPVVTASQPAPPAPVRKAEKEPTQDQEGGLPRSAADWTGDQLRQQIEESAGKALKTGPDWKALAREHGVPEPTSAAELGSRTWLLGMYQALRCADYQEMIASVQATDPGAAERVTQMVAEALSERDRRRIGMAHYDEIRAKGEVRKAELSAPLLAGGQGRAQVAS